MNESAQVHCCPTEANTSRPNEGDVSQPRAELPGWRTHEEEGELRWERSHKFEDTRPPIAFTDQVAQVANEEDHRPAILTEWGQATVAWWTHKTSGPHQNGLIMAAKTGKQCGGAFWGPSVSVCSSIGLT
jgi:4a-hydroxytetrahydrobiopterin dehydratase